MITEPALLIKLKMLDKDYLNYKTDKDAESRSAVIWMFVGGISFATMGALIHALGKNCDWLLIAFFRMLFSFILTSYLAARSGIVPIKLDSPLLWFRSLVGCSAMLATFYSLTKLPVSDVAVVTETRPILVAILAGYMISERSNSRLWVILIFSMVGVVLLEQPYFYERNFAIFVALYASLGGAVVMICLRKLRSIDPRQIVTHFAGTSTIVTLILIVLIRKDVELNILTNTNYLIMLLGVSIFGTIGQLAMTKAFALGEAPRVAAAGIFKVGFSGLYDILIWRHSFGLSTLAGMGFILISSSILLYSKDIFSKKQNI